MWNKRKKNGFAGTEVGSLSLRTSWKRLSGRSFGNHQPRGVSNFLTRSKARVKRHITLLIAKKDLLNGDILSDD